MSINHTSLTKYAHQMRDPDEKGAHRMAARMWHQDGSAIIRRESLDRLPWQDRELIEKVCTKLYGPREQG